MASGKIGETAMTMTNPVPTMPRITEQIRAGPANCDTSPRTGCRPFPIPSHTRAETVMTAELIASRPASHTWGSVRLCHSASTVIVTMRTAGYSITPRIQMNAQARNTPAITASMRAAAGVLRRNPASTAAAKHEITASVKIVVEARPSSRYSAMNRDRRAMNFCSYR